MAVAQAALARPRVACGGAPRREVAVRLEVAPAAPYRLPRYAAPDGLARFRGGVLRRLLHVEGVPVVLAAAQPRPEAVVLAAQSRSRDAALAGIERWRFALGVDVDVAPFLRAFRRDPVLGASIRRRPWLRVARRPEPFEALAWAICEQLIEYSRAAAIERRIVARLGRRLGTLRDLPDPETLAGTHPALLQSFDLGAARAQALVAAASEVARGRIDLDAAEHERGWRRLRAIRGIGSWTVEMLAVHGQGREDQVPAGDLGLLKGVGRALGDGDPRAFASEDEVRRFFEPYGEWKALAASHVLAI